MQYALRLIFSALFMTTASLTAIEVHVSPSGSDAFPGTQSQPVRSLQRAQELVRGRGDESSSRTVILHNGVWRVTEALEFDPEDSRTTWRALVPGGATLSGGEVIEGWKMKDDGTWVATVPSVTSGGWIFRELFANGVRATRARTPNDGYFRIAAAAKDKRTGFTFHPGDVRNIDDLQNVELVFLHDWSITRVGVQSVNEVEHLLVTENNIGASARHYAIDWFEEHPRYFLENSINFLDAPGEWFLNRDTGELHYRPLPGQTISTTEFVAPVATRLIHVLGNDEKPVRELRFEGIHFEHCAWQIPENGYAEGQANYHEPRTDESGILREIIPAAIQFERAVDCSITGANIAHLGGGGLWFGSRTHSCILKNSHLVDIAGNGILVGEDRGRTVDGSPWWQSRPEQAASNNSIENCEVEQTGRQFYGAVGIWVGLTDGTLIRNNEIHHLPYTGVSLGWMWNRTSTPTRNNLVEGNHIHHVMQVLSDGGGIYTLGMQPGTVLRNNVIHDVPVNLGRAESNGMFLDEGTTGIVIENNVIYNVDRSPLRFHQATTNTVRNNLLVVKENIPSVRYNSTRPEDITQIENTIAVVSKEVD